MRPILAAALALSAASLACSHTSNPALPVDTAALTPSIAVFGPSSAPDAAGMVTGALGAYALEVDKVNLTATLAPDRLAQTQGDLYQLSVRPFFKGKSILVTGVQAGAAPDTLDIAVQFTHPFAAPADLTPPASATKRIDLHIFDLTAVLVAEGSDSFTFAPDPALVTNGRLLTNADGYRQVGGTFDTAALGITTANLFPYKLVANIDTGNPLGTYNPAANGWQNAALQGPTGYDVFPQGGVATAHFILDLNALPASLQLVPIAKYMDPRSTPAPKTHRLPDGDPTHLQYILPEAAGDVERITASPTGPLIGGSATETISVNVDVLDWDHGAAVATTFPNNADLGQIAEESDIKSVELCFPTIKDYTAVADPPGIAPIITTSLPLNNVLLADPLSSTEVLGLIRVEDHQDDSATRQPITLDEDLLPVGTLDSTRYQIVRITVDPGSSGPTCPDFPTTGWPLTATQGYAWKLDLD
ncbi:MAG: hypothetical protein ABI743_13625, partial [bacterium]